MTEIRDLARRGDLSNYVQNAAPDELWAVRAATYEIVQPVVFIQLTRKLETRRGHVKCAASVLRMEDVCLDRFHDDMDAVIDDVFQYARVPIVNLEGWVSRRLKVATVNGYRRRRSGRGALQRPRVPCWLATALGDDARLTALAVDLLEFVGNDVCAGPAVWPTEQWARRHVGGDDDAAQRAVLGDVEKVLTAMRSRPAWYEARVEWPLGRKPHPTVPLAELSADCAGGAMLSAPADPDSVLLELAGLAVDTIRARTVCGEDPRSVVRDVVSVVFGGGLGADELDLPPGAVSTPVAELVAGQLADPAGVDRITDVALSILGVR